MKTTTKKRRLLEAKLPSQDRRKIVLVTGARQTGKTTLIKATYQDLPYLNLDALEYRDRIDGIPATQWARDLGPAIFDEAQKSPGLFDKIKYAFDEGSIDFSVLSGSSQILLLKKIRESLAGRISIFELFPLTLAELYPENDQFPDTPLMDTLLTSDAPIGDTLEKVPSVLFDGSDMARRYAQDHLLTWGGMPALLHIPKEERMQWLKDYELSYLERDLADLTRLSDLQPFRTLQKLAALRTTGLLNFSELARDAGISADTVRRYLEYLKLSYQIELVQPYYRNLTSSVVKTPKIYWLDIGIWRCLSGFNGTLSGTISGELFENYIVSEIIKWIKTLSRPIDYYFYRTRHGLEIDLLLQHENKVVGLEIKSRQKVYSQDAKAMKEVSQALGSEWKGGIIVYDGDKIEKIAEPDIWAIPGWRLLT